MQPSLKAPVSIRQPAFAALVGAGMLATVGGMPMANAYADVARGADLAGKHCTRCHVVGDLNPTGGIESTPSFSGIKYLADWERRFGEFYILPPHPALVQIAEVTAERDAARPAFVQEIHLTLEDVDAILAFVRTLPTPDR